MDDGHSISVEILPGLDAIAASDWDACACPEVADGGPALDPFTTHRFLHALEASGSVGPGTGWQPRHLVARMDDMVIAVAPVYAKSHSMGEYVFDHSWAHAFENAGGEYYPKLQQSVPFTPATGRRFLTRPGFEAAGVSALVQGAVQFAAENDVSSLHITFCTEAEAVAGEKMGLLRRTGQQFHWVNDGYATFDNFLGALNSRKRKTIRKERRQAQGFGGRIDMLTGNQIRPEHWDDFWRFYNDTGARKWGQPYLTRAFFDIAQDTLRDDMALVMCSVDGRNVAGALNFIGREALFGRYWGCVEDFPCLHFEACYYQAIDFAIAHGLTRVEAGAQGTHKLARGYMPVETQSLHWIGDPGFRNAVAQYLEAERRAVAEENAGMAEFGPFRKVDVEEFE